eukprot:13428773-Alexandrium_andersonii.AAC.1
MGSVLLRLLLTSPPFSWLVPVSWTGVEADEGAATAGVEAEEGADEARVLALAGAIEPEDA